MYYDGIIVKPQLNELYHHGIKGQKWGVRNGPPYPLQQKRASGTDKEAKKSKVGMIDPVSIAIIATYSTMLLAPAIAYAIDKHKKKVEFIEAQERTKHIDELREGAKIDEKTGLRRKKDHTMSREDDMAAVNYDRGIKEKTKDTYTNCTYCSAAYDLRRRGYEVSAGGEKTGQGIVTSDVATWYKDGKMTEFSFTEAQLQQDPAPIFKSELLKQPNGSRGNLCVRWAFGGGHSVAYEIINNDLVIFDCQSNTKYEGKEVDEFLNSAVLQDWAGFKSEYIRTDNLTPDIELMKKKGIIQ